MKGLPRLPQGTLDRRLERDPAGRSQRLHWQEIDEFATKEVRVGGTPGKFSHSRKGGSLPEPVEDQQAHHAAPVVERIGAGSEFAAPPTAIVAGFVHQIVLLPEIKVRPVEPQ